MKVRITTTEKDAPETVSEVTTEASNLHRFILSDMELYPNMEELKADFDHTEFREGYALLRNDNANENYQHVYEVVG